MNISQKRNFKIFNFARLVEVCKRQTFCNLKSKLKSAHCSLFTVHRLKGFTLIEIMVVVIIIGILLAIVAPRLIGRTDEAKVVQAKAQMKNFDTAIKLFKLDNGFYPSTEQGLEALVSKPTIGKIPENYQPGGYLEKKKVPLDPWNNYFVYIAPGLENSYDIICYGADGKPGGERYDADITNWDL